MFLRTGDSWLVSDSSHRFNCSALLNSADMLTTPRNTRRSCRARNDDESRTATRVQSPRVGCRRARGTTSCWGQRWQDAGPTSSRSSQRALFFARTHGSSARTHEPPLVLGARRSEVWTPARRFFTVHAANYRVASASRAFHTRILRQSDNTDSTRPLGNGYGGPRLLLLLGGLL